MNRETLRRYYNDPFGFVDKLNLTLKGHNLNIFQKYKRARRTAFLVAMVSLGAWIIFGFDSTPLQFVHVLYEGILAGNFSLAELGAIYNSYYGREMHYSAFVIYGLMFWGLNRHFDRNLGIKGSRNITYSSSLTFLSVAIFEFFWMWGFATFQDQGWVLTPKWPQLRIHLQNIAFLVVGVLGVLYMWADSYILDKDNNIIRRRWKFNFDGVAFCLIMLSIGWATVWINYPGYVERISVETTTGKWVSSVNFPQTLYTVDLDPTDNVNAGVWFYVEDNMIHGLNTLVKVVWTLTVGYIGLVKQVGGDSNEGETDQ